MDAVVCSRGGYGCARLMHLLDLDQMARAGKLLVGFSDTQLFVNDPISGGQAVAVDRASMLEAWRQLGAQAVTMRTTG